MNTPLIHEKRIPDPWFESIRNWPEQAKLDAIGEKMKAVNSIPLTDGMMSRIQSDANVMAENFRVNMISRLGIRDVWAGVDPDVQAIILNEFEKFALSVIETNVRECLEISKASPPASTP